MRALTVFSFQNLTLGLILELFLELSALHIHFKDILITKKMYLLAEETNCEVLFD